MNAEGVGLTTNDMLVAVHEADNSSEEEEIIEETPQMRLT